MTKNVDYYMNLKYKIVVNQIDESDGGGILLEMPELGRFSTCAWGEAYEEAYAMLREIQRDNIQDLIEKGLDVPKPVLEESYSGRLNLRMSKSLHRRLAEVAQEDGVSLNTLIINSLHESFGYQSKDKFIETRLERIEKKIDRLTKHEVPHGNKFPRGCNLYREVKHPQVAPRS